MLIRIGSSDVQMQRFERFSFGSVFELEKSVLSCMECMLQSLCLTCPHPPPVTTQVQEILVARGWESEYPLFTTTNRIIKGLIPVSMIVKPKVRQGLGPGRVLGGVQDGGANP